MKKTVLRGLQIAVTVSVLAWIFRDSELRAAMGRALRQANPLWLLAGVAVSGLGEIANIWRWGIFLRLQKIEVSWGRIAALFMIGVFFNLFLFGTTGGDIAKIVFLAREQHAKKAAVLLSVIADRWIGLFVLIPFTLLLVWLRYEWLSQTPIASNLLWFLILFALGAGLVIVSAFVISFFGLMRKLPAHIPGRAALIRMAEALQFFTYSKKDGALAFFLSIPVLFTYFGTFYCAARAFAAPASLLDIFSVMPVITVVTSFPISFSGLGVREKLFETLLGDLAHVSASAAVLISLAGFLIYLVWSLVGAVVYMTTRRGCSPP